MWKMTLKQRRRHGELMTRLGELKSDPYLQPPEGYEVGKDPDEDEKYRRVQEAFMQALEELQELESRIAQGD
jgi:hypothetical protein